MPKAELFVLIWLLSLEHVTPSWQGDDVRPNATSARIRTPVCLNDLDQQTCNTVLNKLPSVAKAEAILNSSNLSLSVTAPLNNQDKQAFEELLARGLLRTSAVQNVTAALSFRLIQGFLLPAAKLVGLSEDTVFLLAFGNSTKCNPSNTGYMGPDLGRIRRALGLEQEQSREGGGGQANPISVRELFALVFCMTQGGYYTTLITQLLQAYPAALLFRALPLLNATAVVERWALVQQTSSLPPDVGKDQGLPDFQYPRFLSWSRFDFPASDLAKQPLWKACRKWNGGKISGMYSDDSSILPPLSDDELAYQCNLTSPSLQRTASVRCLMRWYPGALSYDLIDTPFRGADNSGNSGGIGYLQVASGMGWRAAAGPSATTANVLELAHQLGFSKEELVVLRAAMIAWLVLSNDHSFFEVMLGAESYVPTGFGLGFTMHDLSQLWPVGTRLDTSFGSFTSQDVWCDVSKAVFDSTNGPLLVGKMSSAAREYLTSLYPRNCPL